MNKNSILITLVGIKEKTIMTTEAAIAASLQRPESDLEGDSSYVPSLASPTCGDSLDEGSGIYIINK